jgi:hypothetical protein
MLIYISIILIYKYSSNLVPYIKCKLSEDI